MIGFLTRLFRRRHVHTDTWSFRERFPAVTPRPAYPRRTRFADGSEAVVFNEREEADRAWSAYELADAIEQQNRVPA